MANGMALEVKKGDWAAGGGPQEALARLLMQRPQPGGGGSDSEQGVGCSSQSVIDSSPSLTASPDAGAVASASSVMFPSLTDHSACCHLTHLDS